MIYKKRSLHAFAYIILCNQNSFEKGLMFLFIELCVGFFMGFFSLFHVNSTNVASIIFL